MKDYQRDVLKDLNAYMDYVDATGDLKLAFARFWEERGVSVSAQNDDFMHPYRNDVAGVPNVTVKVPTAGGKTFIACNAIDTIFNHYHDDAPRVVAWFVPSDTILKQTYRNLSNTDHPYRQKIDSLFNSRVNVIDKEAALVQADSFIATVLPSQTLTRRIGMVFVPLVMMTGAYLILRARYRIDEKEYDRIVAEIAKRQL